MVNKAKRIYDLTQIEMSCDLLFSCFYYYDRGGILKAEEVPPDPSIKFLVKKCKDVAEYVQSLPS